LGIQVRLFHAYTFEPPESTRAGVGIRLLKCT
jgi:hypothetical protein